MCFLSRGDVSSISCVGVNSLNSYSTQTVVSFRRQLLPYQTEEISYQVDTHTQNI